MTYNCGHGGEAPPNMGRGAAREQRLHNYFGRPCLACALLEAEARERRLTMADGSPRPEAHVAARIAAEAERIRRRY